MNIVSDTFKDVNYYPKKDSTEEFNEYRKNKRKFWEM